MTRINYGLTRSEKSLLRRIHMNGRLQVTTAGDMADSGEGIEGRDRHLDAPVYQEPRVRVKMDRDGWPGVQIRDAWVHEGKWVETFRYYPAPDNIPNPAAWASRWAGIWEGEFVD